MRRAGEHREELRERIAQMVAEGAPNCGPQRIATWPAGELRIGIGLPPQTLRIRINLASGLRASRDGLRGAAVRTVLTRRTLRDAIARAGRLVARLPVAFVVSAKVSLT